MQWIRCKGGVGGSQLTSHMGWQSILHSINCTWKEDEFKTASDSWVERSFIRSAILIIVEWTWLRYTVCMQIPIYRVDAKPNLLYIPVSNMFYSLFYELVDQHAVSYSGTALSVGVDPYLWCSRNRWRSRCQERATTYTDFNIMKAPWKNDPVLLDAFIYPHRPTVSCWIFISLSSGYKSQQHSYQTYKQN